MASSKFCSNCGNASLIRVKAVTDDQGHTQYSPLSVKQFSRRGLKVIIVFSDGSCFIFKYFT